MALGLAVAGVGVGCFCLSGLCTIFAEPAQAVASGYLRATNLDLTITRNRIAETVVVIAMKVSAVILIVFANVFLGLGTGISALLACALLGYSNHAVTSAMVVGLLAIFLRNVPRPTH